MGLAPTGLVVLVPGSMYFTALQAVNASIIGSTTNVMQGAARVILFPHITTATTFYTLKADEILRPFIFQDREPIEVGARQQDSDRGFETEQYLFGVRARYRVTYGPWQRCIRSVFA